MTFEKYIIIKYEKLIFCGISIFERSLWTLYLTWKCTTIRS